MDPWNVDLPSADQQFVLSLCSGGGGLDLGVQLALPAARTVGYVEIEIPAVCCLVAHMEAGELDAAPLWTDLKTFDSGRWCGCVDGVVGGYPCQPFSVSGKKQGKDDPRHLWPVIADHLVNIAPTWCFFENVGHHLRLGFDQVADELSAMGFRIAAGVFTAAEIGAPHRRERLFILATLEDAISIGRIQSTEAQRDDTSWGRDRDTGEIVGDSNPEHDDRIRDTGPRWGTESTDTRATVVYVGNSHYPRSQGLRESFSQGPDESSPWPPGPEDDVQWRRVLITHPTLAPAVKSGVRGMAHGMADRVDRLRILGNGVVPAQAAFAFRCLSRDLGLDWC